MKNDNLVSMSHPPSGDGRQSSMDGGQTAAAGQPPRPLTKEELQFLPAALEIIETPPSPIGRALTWLLMALFTIALIWSIVGRIDEVAVAQGRVVPSGFTNVVQAEDSGIVARIHVENGSRVRQGDVLIELDTVMTEADVTRLTQERDFYQLTLMRLAAEEGMEPFTPARLRHISPLERERQMRLYQSRMEDYRSRLRVAQKGIAQAEEQVRQARIVRQRFATQVTMAREREERVRVVSERGGIAGFTHQEYLERYLSLRQDLRAQDSEIARTQQLLAQAEAELVRISNERRMDISTQVVDSARNLRVIEEELVKAQERHRLTQIRSPIDGTVQQLEIHTIGAVVTPAQPLMQVVPEGVGLQFEVWAINRDIGFIYEGQEAEIKVETFSFQRYGTLPAVVDMVATEAVDDPIRGLIYRVMLSAERDYFIVGNRKVYLIPGMAVTAEIKTTQKRVIEFFLDPFRTYISEGLRER